MEYLPRKYRKALIRIIRNPPQSSSKLEETEEQRLLSAMNMSGLVSIGINEDGGLNYNDVHATEKGRHVLYEQRRDAFRYWVPVGISLLALALSVLSLFLR